MVDPLDPLVQHPPDGVADVVARLARPLHEFTRLGYLLTERSRVSLARSMSSLGSATSSRSSTSNGNSAGFSYSPESPSLICFARLATSSWLAARPSM